jgi:hypothetical protein
MTIFGFVLVRKSYLDRVERSYYVEARAIEACHWFSGWKDLAILWDYIFGLKETTPGGTEVYKRGSIGPARSAYAKARGTDEYGKVLEESRIGFQ